MNAGEYVLVINAAEFIKYQVFTARSKYNSLEEIIKHLR